MRALCRIEGHVLLTIVVRLLSQGNVAGFLFLPGGTHFQCQQQSQQPQQQQSLPVPLALVHRKKTSGAKFQDIRTSRCLSSNDNYNNENQVEHGDANLKGDAEYHTLTVSYESIQANVRVYRNETILAALERSPEVIPGCALPSDCRRGNCLTCTAQHMPGSQVSHLQPAAAYNSAAQRGTTSSEEEQLGDGLSPAMSKHVKDLGYVLTCSSSLSGNGVNLRLNVNDQAWQDLYRVRLEDEEQTRQIARQAVARVMRRSAERNVAAWAKQTEEALKRSSGSGGL